MGRSCSRSWRPRSRPGRSPSCSAGRRSMPRPRSSSRSSCSRWSAGLKHSGTPPFFSLLLGTTAATVLAALTARLGFGVDVGLLMAASLIQFLPGGALLAGRAGPHRPGRRVRDGPAVRGAAHRGRRRERSHPRDRTVARAWASPSRSRSRARGRGTPWSRWLAAAIAVAAYAYQVAVPAFALAWVAVLGAMAWSLYALVGYSPEVGTFVAAVAVGAAGRLLARRYQAPATLWVVPAILPLLPGLALVVALLAPSDAAALLGPLGRDPDRVRARRRGRRGRHHGRRRSTACGDGVVEPAVRAAATGIGVLVLPPSEEKPASDGNGATSSSGRSPY